MTAATAPAHASVQLGPPPALPDTAALYTHTSKHIVAMSGSQPLVATPSLYTVPSAAPATTAVVYTQPWSIDVIDVERPTAYDNFIHSLHGHRPSTVVDQPLPGARPLAAGSAGPARNLIEPVQLNTTHPHALTTTPTSGSNSVIGTGECLSLFAGAPSHNWPPQSLPSADQAQVSTALQSHISTLNSIARDAPAINSAIHIPLDAGNYGSQLGMVLPGCVPNLAERPAVHTTNSQIGDAYTYHAPAGAFITNTSQGPAVAFPIEAYLGWGSASTNVGYPNPGPALPTSAVSGPSTSTVHPALILPSAVLTASSLPLLTDSTPTTTTAGTGTVVDSMSSKLAPGLEFLAMVPRPPGIETYSTGQLPVPAVAAPTAQPLTATTPAAVQPPGSQPTTTTAVPASTAATAVVTIAPPQSTMTSSAVPTTSTTTDAASTVLQMSTTTSSAVTVPSLATNTLASSSSSTGVAVVGSSGSIPPGSTYVAATQSVTPPIVVVYSQDVLKRYDGSSSPKEFMDHFDIIADVNGWKTELDKLKHLKAALDGRVALQIKDLDESDPVKAFAALRDRLLGHFGSSDEVQSARRKFKHRLQLKGEAIDEFADALLKLNRAGWPGQPLDHRDTKLQNQFVDGLRLTELQEYLRLQYADLGFEETVKKARRYVEIKDTSKPRKASVRFASTERDPAVNTITSSTVDLELVMYCLKNIQNRMDKMERRGQSARSLTPPSRPTSPRSRKISEVDRRRDNGATTPATCAFALKTSKPSVLMMCRRRITLPIRNPIVSRHRRQDGTTSTTSL